MPRRTHTDKSQQRKRAVPKVRRMKFISRKPKKKFVAEPVKIVPLMSPMPAPTLDRWDE